MGQGSKLRTGARGAQGPSAGGHHLRIGPNDLGNGACRGRGEDLWDLATLRAFKEARFPIGEWDRRERFAKLVINESEKWVQDKLEGKDVEGDL